MAQSAISTVSDLLATSAGKIWEDPVIVLERSLVVKAQGVPPVGGPPEAGPDRGFLGPLSVSIGGGGFC